MDFVQSLRAEHLQSFWYSGSKYCFALIGTFVSLLWVTAQDKEEAERYRAKLDEYRWTLRLSSKSADFLERAISMLATSTGVLVKAIPDKPNAEYFLNRHTKRLTAANAPVPIPDTQPQADSAGQDSESETPGELSTDGDVGASPSTSGAASGDYMSDHLWFGSTPHISSIDSVYAEANAGLTGMQPTYLGMAEISGGYDYQGYEGQSQIGESGS
jgi:hypothetical protein